MTYHINTSKSLKGRTLGSNLYKKGSITLEAALVVSFFFLAILCLTYILEIMVLQTTIANGLRAVGKELAVEVYSNPMLMPSKVKRRLVEKVGKEYLDDSLIAGGAAGLDCGESKKPEYTMIMDLSVVYYVELPILIFRIPLLRQEESFRIKGWSGYEGMGGVDTLQDMVYVTEHGLVFHEDRDCTYLDFNMKAVNQESIGEMRNQSGGKYYACGYCDGGRTEKALVYITDYGTHYHSTLDCSRIKRQVYEVPRKQIYGIGGCSKCVK